MGSWPSRAGRGERTAGKRRSVPNLSRGVDKVRSALDATRHLPRLSIELQGTEETDDLLGERSEYSAPPMAQPRSPTTNGDDPAWKRLGMYTVLGEIAEGTFGTVKLAKHTITGHRVAMKYLAKARIQASNTKSRVRKEVEYMRLLRHPHIVRLYEVINTPTDIVLVLEYAGGELFQLIVDNGRMDEPNARKFFQQMMSGVAYSHRLGVAHRDLKPENVLLDADNNVKITDFGLSNALTDGEFLKTSCGSPNYAAPEIIAGKFYTGPDIDVWSSGVILYVMLCGRLPFENPAADANNTSGLYKKIAEGIYHVPSYLSHDAKSLLARMLAVDPVKRITVPEIFQHPFVTRDLSRYLQPLPPGPGPVSSLTSLLAPPKHKDYIAIPGIGRIEDNIIDELAKLLQLDKEVIWSAIRLDGPNSIKVTYCLLRDKNRVGKDFSDFAEQERESQLSQLSNLDPLGQISPVPLTSPRVEEHNPYEEVLEDFDEDESDSDDELDFSVTQQEQTFAVLHTSIPGHEGPSRPLMGPQAHHLTSYASAIRSNPGSPAPREKKSKTRWHFGIRSRSPPMEVMLEIYQTLEALGMQWREKKGIWGRKADVAEPTDYKEYMSIFSIETRGRIKDVTVLMDLQLYQVDSINFLVDFKNVAYYRASTAAGAGKFEMAVPIQRRGRGEVAEEDESVTHGANGDGTNKEEGEEDETLLQAEETHKEVPVCSPFLFLEIATKLIIELAGGGAGSNPGSVAGSVER